MRHSQLEQMILGSPSSKGPLKLSDSRLKALEFLESDFGSATLATECAAKSEAGGAFEQARRGVVVKTLVPFWVLSIIRHLIFRGPTRGP